MSAQGLMGMEEETKLVMKKQGKQGIVTILTSDSERNRASSSSSLRRTLSADMSSKKWLSQNGFFSPMKKTVSSQKLSHNSDSSSSDSESSDEERKDLEAESVSMWKSIQEDKNKKKESEKNGAFDMWSSIVTQKTNDSLAPPYIHPLVKRSQSSLSEKSLEICTESLGSETGSDGFYSYSSSEAEEEKDVEEEEEEEKESVQEYKEEEVDYVVPKFKYCASSKKSGPRCFPPPIPSLSCQDGPSLHMRSHRENGRLVLEAVSVPSLNNFSAHRQDGRLLLTFNNNLNNYEDFYQDDDDEEEEYDVEVDEEIEEEYEECEKDEEEEENDDDGDEEEDEEEKEEDEIEKSEREAATILCSRIDTSSIGFTNSNPKWSEKLNKVVSSDTAAAVKSSLPPRPRVARLVPLAQGGANFSAASYFNPYECFWRSESPYHHHPKNNSSNKHVVCEDIDQMPHEQQKLMVERGKNVDYLVHNWRSCKESRRSLLFREPPQCIAT